MVDEAGQLGRSTDGGRSWRTLRRAVRGFTVAEHAVGIVELDRLTSVEAGGLTTPDPVFQEVITDSNVTAAARASDGAWLYQTDHRRLYRSVRYGATQALGDARGLLVTGADRHVYRTEAVSAGPGSQQHVLRWNVSAARWDTLARVGRAGEGLFGEARALRASANGALYLATAGFGGMGSGALYFRAPGQPWASVPGDAYAVLPRPDGLYVGRAGGVDRVVGVRVDRVATVEGAAGALAGTQALLVGSVQACDYGNIDGTSSCVAAGDAQRVDIVAGRSQPLGFGARRPYALRVSARGDTLLVVTERGLWQRAGDRWTSLDDGTLPRGDLATDVVRAPWGDVYVSRAGWYIHGLARYDGRAWTLGGPADNISRVEASGDSTLMVVARGYLFRSPDRGRTFVRVLPEQTRDLARTSSGWLAATEAGLYRSEDDGRTWARVLAGATDAVAASVTGDRVIYATQGTRAARSSDDGRTWDTYGEPLPARARRIYVWGRSKVLDSGTRLYYEHSTDGGALWTSVPFLDVPSPDDRTRSRLALGPSGTLFGAFSYGLVSAPQTFISAAPADPEPSTLVLTARPNPFRGALTATLALPAPAHVRADVFDALGRRVATIHDGMAAAGTLALRWNATGVAPGVYVLRVAAGAEAVTARVVRLR